jgi:hypothetical protein
MKNIFLFFLILIFSGHSFGQDTTANKRALTISGYAEIYYSYDFNNPVNNTKPSFFYNFNRNNEVNLNLGFIKASYNTENVRANISLATGTYINSNYISVPDGLKNIFEANAGIKISKKNNLWIDAGIFSSHIGFESAVGSECWNLTRSIVAENTPYYETGVKLGYTSKNNQWFFCALFLNGWQNIERSDDNTTPAFGTQITFTPSSQVSFNYSTFIGSPNADSVREMRYYNDFYATFQINKLLNMMLGMDYGLQQKAKASSSYNMVYAPLLELKFSPDNKNSIAARGEYYSDANGMIISSPLPDGFKVFGYSLNYDRQITANALWRIELRNLNGKDDYFIKQNNSFSNNTSFISTSLSVSF